MTCHAEPCAFQGCDRRRVTGIGYCLMHYKRWKRHGDATVVTVQKRTGKCAVPTCGREDVARGYCGRHVQRLYQGKGMDELPSLFERLGRFEVSAAGCWEWQGASAGKYGQIHILDRPVPVHRLMYELFVGRVPSHGIVCHRCDNPLCIRPDHLFLGTQQDNLDDMVAKGRSKGAPNSPGMQA
jgi:hypothetical protein